MSMSFFSFILFNCKRYKCHTHFHSSLFHGFTLKSHISFFFYSNQEHEVKLFRKLSRKSKLLSNSNLARERGLGMERLAQTRNSNLSLFAPSWHCLRSDLHMTERRMIAQSFIPFTVLAFFFIFFLLITSQRIESVRNGISDFDFQVVLLQRHYELHLVTWNQFLLVSRQSVNW